MLASRCIKVKDLGSSVNMHNLDRRDVKNQAKSNETQHVTLEV